jgi:DNA mismatch repair protein MutS
VERAKVRQTLQTVHDMERLVGRAALGTAGPRDLVALRQSLPRCPRLRMLLDDLQAPLIRSLVAELDDLPALRQDLERTIVDEPPALVRDGGAIRDGVDPELDDLRSTSRSGKQRIAEMEEAERTRTGIASLKIRYNRVFGYYIEISRTNLGAVPPTTSANRRSRAVSGSSRPRSRTTRRRSSAPTSGLPHARWRSSTTCAAASRPRRRHPGRGRALATLDVLAGLADTATACNYTKPLMHAGDELVATDLRHPVVERLSPDAFVPNDVTLDGGSHQLVVLTGPNMGGKSTYLRQTALAVLMAQVGSFVAARTAKLPVVDRIFARVGASDNIARGQSTFMVEMQETANILHAATSRSLVILDEIGRGTATFDGLSLAWAVAEYLASNPTARPKRCSRRTITSSPIWPTHCRAWPTSTSLCGSGTTTSSSSAR